MEVAEQTTDVPTRGNRTLGRAQHGRQALEAHGAAIARRMLHHEGHGRAHEPDAEAHVWDIGVAEAASIPRKTAMTWRRLLDT